MIRAVLQAICLFAVSIPAMSHAADTKVYQGSMCAVADPADVSFANRYTGSFSASGASSYVDAECPIVRDETPPSYPSDLEIWVSDASASEGVTCEFLRKIILPNGQVLETYNNLGTSNAFIGNKKLTKSYSYAVASYPNDTSYSFRCSLPKATSGVKVSSVLQYTVVEY